jgi:redox-sensitive bicupin YhaK (pirin superfamily)
MGFQIWINVPKAHKMDDPRYGTEPPENLPLLTYSGVQIRVLAGSLGEAIGPFNTVQPVQILDIIMEPNMDYSHEIPIELNNVLIYIYRGDGIIAGETVPSYHLIHLDGSDPSKRQITFTSNENGASMLLFAGKRLNEPIAWRGPFVMNTWEEINSTIQEYRNGTFLKKRAPWDYKTLSAFPKDKLPIE